MVRRGRVRWLLPLAAVAVLAGGCARDGRLPPRAGRRLYADSCARCHGPDGSGGRPGAPGRPAPRDLRDPQLQRTRSDDELRAVIRGGRGTDMPPFGVVLDARQIDALVRQVRAFGR